MSQTRARPDPEPTDMTDPKRRSVDPKELPAATLLNTGAIPNIFTDIPPEEKAPSPIAVVKDEPFIMTLAEILENSDSDEFLSKAKHLLKLLKDGLLKSGEDAENFSCMVREVWQDPCFAHGLRTAIEEDWELIGYVLCCSNHDSPTDRMAHMEADRCFKPSLMSIESDTTITTTISNTQGKNGIRSILELLRVFLSILIGHWADQGELRELDKRMGENYFGQRMDLIARHKLSATDLIGKKEEIEDFSYNMEAASDVENMESLRKVLVNKYGQGRLDIEAILEEVKSELLILVDIGLKHLGYDGGKARIEITISDGRYSSLLMHPIQSIQPS